MIDLVITPKQVVSILGSRFIRFSRAPETRKVEGGFLVDDVEAYVKKKQW